MSDCTENHALLLRTAMRHARLTLKEAATLLSMSPEQLGELGDGTRDVPHHEWDRIFEVIERARVERGADAHVCMNVDGVRVKMDPNASPETVEAIRGLIDAVRKMTPEQLDEIRNRRASR